MPSFSAKRLFSNPSLVLYLSMFVMGGCGLAYEYTLSKISSDLLGNSVQQWALIIGVMMFFMGIGSDLQKHISDRYLIDLFIVFEVLLALTGAFAPILLLYTYGVFYSHFVLFQYFFIASIGMLIGLEIPMLTRINATYLTKLSFNLGAMLKMDYIGALCGALAWVFVLPKFFSMTKMAFVLGSLSLFAAAVAFLFFRNSLLKKKWVASVMVSAFCLMGFGLYVVDDWTAHGEQYLYRDPIVFSKTSAYQHVVLTESARGNLSMFINGHLQFNSEDEFIYHENLVHPAMSAVPQRERVLILGGGDGMAAREVLKYEDVLSVTLCDLDPMITELASSNPKIAKINGGSLSQDRVIQHAASSQSIYPGPQESLSIQSQKSRFGRQYEKIAQVHVFNMDAVNFIQEIPGMYDVIILDFPDPSTPELAKLYSKRFYKYLKKRLNPGGLLVQQATSPYYVKEAFLSIGRTMASAGLVARPYHDHVPSFGEWGWWLAGSADDYSLVQLDHLIGEIKEIQVETRYLTADLMKAAFLFSPTALVTREEGINTLMSPVIYEYYKRGWEKLML